MRMTVDRSALRIVFYLKLFGVIQINTSGFVRRTAAVSTIGLTDMAQSIRVVQLQMAAHVYPPQPPGLEPSPSAAESMASEEPPAVSPASSEETASTGEWNVHQ